MDAVIGIDVGTGSARAGIFTGKGEMLGVASHSIQVWKEGSDFVEQSSDDIWQAVCRSVKDAMGKANLTAENIVGVGFDATCSLVAIDEAGTPVTVSPSGDNNRNVIVWMDHRATEQTERINSTKADVLRYVGGTISPEMQTPKLLWLKENLPEMWKKTAHFFDLPDFLTWRATDETSRSLCSTVCKWTYLGHEACWDKEFFNEIGLGDLARQGFERIGTTILPMGQAVGTGLSEKAAVELGLNIGTPVATSIIDAHAGALGIIGASLDGGVVTEDDLERRLALICGTSSCHMAVSKKQCDVSGIWGPYYSAMVPGMWLNEGGQSATGALIDHVIQSHGCGAQARENASAQKMSIYQYLNSRLDVLAEHKEFAAQLTVARHVLPYFHGNRSPRADPHLRGMLTGLSLACNVDDLALTYLATIQAIAYGTRHIVECLNEQGYQIDTVFACGGDCKNPVFLREHADILNCKIVLAKEPEAVVLGAATLGAVASGIHADLASAMSAMNKVGEIIEPSGGKILAYHDRKYRVFHRMYDDYQAYESLMKV